jgi:hypothetical protein
MGFYGDVSPYIAQEQRDRSPYCEWVVIKGDDVKVDEHLRDLEAGKLQQEARCYQRIEPNGN